MNAYDAVQTSQSFQRPSSRKESEHMGDVCASGCPSLVSIDRMDSEPCSIEFAEPSSWQQDRRQEAKQGEAASIVAPEKEYANREEPEPSQLYYEGRTSKDSSTGQLDYGSGGSR